MNFLAHLALSGNDEEVIMGNFSGDYIKGKLDPHKFSGRSSAYVEGIRLHRFIDHFTDSHPAVRRMTRKLAKHHGRAAAVAVDLFFDHLLSLDFPAYHGENLEHFVVRMHRVISEHHELVPEAMLPMVRSMLRHKWLLQYGELASLKKTIDNMTVRYPFLGSLSGITENLSRNFEEYHGYFSEFYPALQKAAYIFLQEAVARGTIRGGGEAAFFVPPLRS